MLGTKSQKFGLLLLIIFALIATSWNFFGKSQEGFKLNVKSTGNGIVKINPHRDKYLPETKIKLKAEAEENSTFVKWEGSFESEQNPIEISIKEDTPITAVFKKKTKIVNFNDSRLERAVREALKQPTGPLYKSEVNDIERLEAAGKGIQNLKGIENLTSLEYLDLGRKWENGGWNYNIIVDLSPISNLINLNFLELSGNKIKDIKALVENNGIDSGDYINLRYNNLESSKGSSAMKSIEKLENRKVDIKYSSD